MRSKKLNTKADKKNTIDNSKDNLVSTNLKKYGDNISINSVKTNEIMRCHICCKNFSTEEFYYHKKIYHLAPSINTDSSIKFTVSSKKKKISSKKKTDSSTKNTQKIDYNNTKKPGITTKLNEKVPLEGGYDDWKCILCPSLILDSSALLQHVKTYHHLNKPRHPVKQCLTKDNIPVVLLKHDNYTEVVGKRWARSIKEHIKAVLEFKLIVRRFHCDFCKKICMDPYHFEINQWSRGTMIQQYECTMCPRSFATHTQLEMHKSILHIH